MVLHRRRFSAICKNIAIIVYTVEMPYRGHHLDPAVFPVYRGIPNSEVDLYTTLYMWLGLQRMPSLER